MPGLDTLLASQGWTLWVTEPGRNSPKPLKVPVHPDGITRHSLANPAPLMSGGAAHNLRDFLRMAGTYHDDPTRPGYVGVGFRPQPGIGCLDLDNCVDPATGNWSPAAHMVFSLILPGAAVELSVSRRGLHFWFTYTGPGYGIRHCKDHPQLGDFDLFQGPGAFVALGTYLGGDAATDCTAGIEMLAGMAWPEAAPGAMRQTGADDWATLDPIQRAGVVEDLRAALAYVPDAGNANWIRVMNALKSIGEDGKQLWFDWSRGQIPGQRAWSGDAADDWELERQWSRPYAGLVRRATVFQQAADAGWTNPARGPQIDPETVFTALPTPVHPGPAALPAPTGTWDGLSSPLATKFGGTASLLALHEELRECEPLFRVAHDDFRDRTMLGRLGQWSRLEPKDVTWVRRLLLARGYKKVGKEDILDVIEETAAQNHFDSAVMWADSLKWDGVPRVETAMSRYFATADTPYTRAVAWYLFTALAGRLYAPGCQADMAVILISEAQGRRKSSCIQALVPDVEAYTTADFGQDDKELAMRVRGRLVVELPEMVGWNKRTQAHIRDWVTRRHEQWRGMHSNELSTYPRRFVLMGTGNDKPILDDPTGARRWLPCDVIGTGDHEALARDRDQLWAEGIVAWRQGGIRWQQAAALATEAHEEFSTDGDPWEAYIEEWLDAKPAFGEAPTNGSRPLLLSDILLGALQIRRGDASKSDQMRAGAILRKLGWSKKTRMVGGKLGKFWSR